MQTINQVFNWSCFLSGVTGLMVLGAASASWVIIEVLVLLVDITAA